MDTCLLNFVIQLQMMSIVHLLKKLAYSDNPNKYVVSSMQGTDNT